MINNGAARSDSNGRFCQNELIGIPSEDPGFLEEWYESITKLRFRNETDAIMSLKNEASIEKEYKSALEIAMRAGKRMRGLTTAECLAVTMYTVNDPPFYKTFNECCRKGSWADYEVFSTLLYSACQKLRNLDPVGKYQVLYRGLRTTTCNTLPGEFFWPQFTSTSMSKEIAEQFSQSWETILQFDSCIHGAKIGKLSMYEEETEVLITPFEAFDYKNERQRSDRRLQLYFGVCTNQPILKPQPYASTTLHEQRKQVENKKQYRTGGLNCQLKLKPLASFTPNAADLRLKTINEPKQKQSMTTSMAAPRLKFETINETKQHQRGVLKFQSKFEPWSASTPNIADLQLKTIDYPKKPFDSLNNPVSQYTSWSFLAANRNDPQQNFETVDETKHQSGDSSQSISRRSIAANMHDPKIKFKTVDKTKKHPSDHFKFQSQLKPWSSSTSNIAGLQLKITDQPKQHQTVVDDDQLQFSDRSTTTSITDSEKSSEFSGILSPKKNGKKGV